MKKPRKPSAKTILARTGKNIAGLGKTPKPVHKKLTIHQHHLAQLRARKAAHTRLINKLVKEGKLKPVASKKRAAMMPVTPEDTRLPGYSWVLGCNDDYPTCAAAAVANHLYAMTGIAMREDEVLDLHKLAGGDEDGASIGDVLEFLQGGAQRFCHGTFRLQRWAQTDVNVIVTGLVVGLDLPHGSHAVLSHPDGMVSWGRVIPWQGNAEEAWAVEWLW